MQGAGSATKSLSNDPHGSSALPSAGLMYSWGRRQEIQGPQHMLHRVTDCALRYGPYNCQVGGVSARTGTGGSPRAVYNEWLQSRPASTHSRRDVHRSPSHNRHAEPGPSLLLPPHLRRAPWVPTSRRSIPPTCTSLLDAGLGSRHRTSWGHHWPGERPGDSRARAISDCRMFCWQGVCLDLGRGPAGTGAPPAGQQRVVCGGQGG